MKHAAVEGNWSAINQRDPKHDAGWTPFSRRTDWESSKGYTPGRHAKPFGKHHPATPVTYDRAGNTTPLATVTPNLDVAA